MRPRTRTVLFTDLVGSTELRSRLGERKAEQARQAHFATLGGEIRRSHGRELKNLGDGVMAVFESARDGIECAVAIQRACAHARGASAGRIEVRIGLASGDVSDDGGDCFGLPVVEASRLCARARGAQILVGESTRLLVRDYRPLSEIGLLDLRGLDEPSRAWEAEWSATAPARVRAVLADDSVLVREGVAHVLEAAGIEVVGQAADGEALLQLTDELRPDLAVVDVRMPPTYTLEGLEAAEEIRRRHEATAVLVLTQDVQPRHAQRLLDASPSRIGYLLKERVTDGRAFAESAREVAAGGTVFDWNGLSP